ncbi:MAG TPA: ThiF family adenylyltransferase, partial [Methylophilus sp.]
DNVTHLLDFQASVIVDCMDDAKAKIALAQYCQQNSIPLIMVGSAGGKLDPTKIEVTDLAHVVGDRLLAKVRNQLRRDHGFPKASNNKKSAKFNIQAVYSDEPVLRPMLSDDTACELPDNASITGLNCAGYGSSVCVTAPFGFTAAQCALNLLLKA